MIAPAQLPYPRTKVTATIGGHTTYGVVDDYEHYRVGHTTFPVKFGSTTRIMTTSEVTVLPDDQQPPNRKPPQHTGYYMSQDCASCSQ